MASTSIEGGRGDQGEMPIEKPDGQTVFSALQKQVKSLKRRLQVLEHENQMLLSRMNSCRHCHKMGLKGKLFPQCKASWTDDYKKAFIDICIDEVRRGNRPTTSFNRSGWVNVTERFNDLMGTKYVKGQFKNLYAVMRESWREWKSLVNRVNGWGWDPVLQTVDCDPQTWEEYCKSHKQAKQFLTRPLLYEDELDELFRGTVASDGETYCSSDPDIAETPTKPPLPPQPPDQFEESYSMETLEPSDMLSEDPLRALNSRQLPTKKRKKLRASCTETVPPSAADVIRLLDLVEGVEMGGDLYLGAMRVLRDPIEREFFVAMDPCVRAAWLRSMVYGDKPG